MSNASLIAGPPVAPELISAPGLGRRQLLRRAAFGLAALAALLAVASLVSRWVFDAQIFLRLIEHPGMAVSSAAGLFAVALMVMLRGGSRGLRRRGYSPLVPALLLAVALLDLLLLAILPRRGVDQLLFGSNGAPGEAYMSPATAVCLALAATALLLPLRRRHLAGVDAYGIVTAAGLAIPVFALTGYFFDSAALREVIFFAAMSPQTALGFLLLFAALAAAQPAHGWMRVIFGAGPGSATLRRTLPFLVLGPFVFCWLVLIAVESGVFNANFRLSVLALAGSFCLVGLAIWSARRQNADAVDLMRSNRELRRALDERGVLLREVYHRVKNNLQFVDAMLALEANKPAGDSADLEQRLRAVRRRVHALALVHQQLMDSQDLATLRLDVYLREICGNMVRGAGLDQERVDLEVDTDELNIDLDRAIPIGLVIAELLSNVAKHAFPGERRGTVWIAARAAGEGFIDLSVADDGVGRPAGLPEHTGSTILRALVDQLNAEMSVQDGQGYRVTLRVPLGS